MFVGELAIDPVVVSLFVGELAIDPVVVGLFVGELAIDPGLEPVPSARLAYPNARAVLGILVGLNTPQGLLIPHGPMGLNGLLNLSLPPSQLLENKPPD